MAKIYTSRATTQSGGEVDMSGALTPLKMVTNVAEKQAEKYATQAYDSLETGLKTDTKVEMNALYQEYQGNPQELAVQFESMNEELKNKMPIPEVYDSVIQSNLVSQSAFVAKAEGNFRKSEVKKAKMVGTASVETNMGMLEGVADIWFDPEDTEEKNAIRATAQQYLNEVGKQLYSEAPDGSMMFTPAQIEKYQGDLDKIKVAGYKNNLDEMFLSNPNSAMDYITEVESDPKGFQKKTGLSRKEYDTVKTYNNSLRTLVDKKKKGINPNTGLPYTEQELLVIQENSFAVLTEHKLMDIKNTAKTGEATKLEIMNDEYDNIRSLVTFKDNLDDSFKHGGTSEAKAQTMQAQTDAILLRKMQDNDLDFTTMWGTTAEEHMAKTAVEYNGMNDSERVHLFRAVYKDALTEGIDLGDDRRSTRQKVQKLIEDNAKDIQRMQYTSIGMRQPAKVITDYGLADYSSEPETGGVNIDGAEGGEIYDFQGEKWKITRNKLGIVKHRSRVD